MLYRYILPINSESVELSRSLPYPIVNVNALVADVGAEVSSDQLTVEGLRTTEAGSYTNLVGQDIPANQPVAIRLDGLSRPSASASGPVTGNRALLFVLIGLAGLGAAGLVAWPMLRGEGRSPLAPDGAEESQEALLDALSQLDIAFEAGEIDQSIYREERLQLKTRLLDAARQGSATRRDG